MEEKGFVKKMGNKIVFGVLFVAACFIASYVLVEYSYDLLFVVVAAVLLLVSAFLFLNALFSGKAKEWAPEEKVETTAPGNGDGGEFRLKVTKHIKEMENTQKEMLEVLKKQNTLLQSQIENLEHEIYMLSEKQVNQAKSIIKFNKENARQLAISERETLEHVMLELKKAIEDNAVEIPTGFVAASAADTVAQTVPASEPELETASGLEEVSEEDLFTVSDLPGDDEYVVPEVPVVPEAEPVEEVPAVEEMEIPEMPADIDLTELFDIPELEETPADAETVIPEMPADIEIPLPEEQISNLIPEPEPVVNPEPQPVSEPAPAADPLAGLNSDPNAMMSPEDIAKLLAAMGQ